MQWRDFIAAVGSAAVSRPPKTPAKRPALPMVASLTGAYENAGPLGAAFRRGLASTASFLDSAEHSIAKVPATWFLVKSNLKCCQAREDKDATTGSHRGSSVEVLVPGSRARGVTSSCRSE